MKLMRFQHIIIEKGKNKMEKVFQDITFKEQWTPSFENETVKYVGKKWRSNVIPGFIKESNYSTWFLRKRNEASYEINECI